VVGNVVPFLAGLAFLGLYDTSRFLGPAGDRFSFGLVFALAMAVTSFPVISRIMADHGILGTRFARIVLSVALLEDVAVYVVLNIALAMVALPSAKAFGLPQMLRIEPTSAVGSGYYVVLTLGFLALPALFGPGLVQRLSNLPRNVLHRSSPIAFPLMMVLALSALASFLGVSPIFGALVAGILAGDLHGESARAKQTIQSYSYAFFVPLYFAVVGLRLDLVHHFEPLFFVFFLLFACSAKSISCYLGARMTGETRPGARNLAVALNARGGPGIVLASVAFDARIINEGFYTILVMLALVTSVIAGSWLEAILKRGGTLLTDDEESSRPLETSSGIDEPGGIQVRPVASLGPSATQ
jgi:Kef-type K+ transport system membrane component KefB